MAVAVVAHYGAKGVQPQGLDEFRGKVLRWRCDRAILAVDL